MNLLAATATASLIYAGVCAWMPFAYCWLCEGSGQRTRKDGRVFARCSLCRGSGRRLRIGRRIYNAVQRRRA